MQHAVSSSLQTCPYLCACLTHLHIIFEYCLVIYKAAPVKNHELVIADRNLNGAKANAEG